MVTESTKKGAGKRVVNTLDNRQLVKLIRAVEKNLERFAKLGCSFDDAASLLREELDFAVTGHNVKSACAAADLKWERRRIVGGRAGKGGYVRRQARVVAGALADLYRQLSCEVPPSLAQVVLELAPHRPVEDTCLGVDAARELPHGVSGRL